MIEVNLMGRDTATEVFLDQLRSGEGDLVNIRRSQGAPLELETRYMPQPNGGSTAGPRRCVRSCCLTFG